MKPYLLLVTLIIGAASVFFESGRAQSPFDPVIAEMISHVSDSTMVQSIANLQAFETRYSFASTRDTVARWIRGRFLAAGITDAVFDSFQVAGIELVNVVATIRGASDSEIVVGAHYDSYSPAAQEYAPGADDDASGTSAVMELARVISAHGYKPASTIRFVAFSGEEQGLQGSSVYAWRAKSAERHIRAMLNFDQIGYRNVGDTDVYLVWYQGGEALAALDTTVIRRYTTLTPLLSTEPRTRSDSYSFARQGYPAVWWLEHQSTPFYHTTYDLVDFIDGAYAAEIARSALALVLTLDKSTNDVPRVAVTLPAVLHLYQNYPNPFNPSTTIRYALPERSHVTLSIFDLLGQQVETLVRAEQEAGYHEVTFNGLGFSSGIYFYRFTARDYAQTRKCLLLR